ncbi:MAG TPA: hypothetical protein VJ550_08015 [Geomonas sp.]|nr:hypothetical protein [Geomonas sp.]
MPDLAFGHFGLWSVLIIVSAVIVLGTIKIWKNMNALGKGPRVDQFAGDEGVDF